MTVKNIGRIKETERQREGRGERGGVRLKEMKRERGRQEERNRRGREQTQLREGKEKKIAGCEVKEVIRDSTFLTGGLSFIGLNRLLMGDQTE